MLGGGSKPAATTQGKSAENTDSAQHAPQNIAFTEQKNANCYGNGDGAILQRRDGESGRRDEHGAQHQTAYQGAGDASEPGEDRHFDVDATSDNDSKSPPSQGNKKGDKKQKPRGFCQFSASR